MSLKSLKFVVVKMLKYLKMIYGLGRDLSAKLKNLKLTTTNKCLQPPLVVIIDHY